MKNDANLQCSYCCKPATKVERLFKSEHGANICNECVALLNEQTADLDAQNTVTVAVATTAEVPEHDECIRAAFDALSVMPTPREINEYLNEHVIGQDDAKKTLSVAVYNHYKRRAHDEHLDDIELGKSNLLLIGSTGTGKTEIARAIARKCDVPFVIVDANSLTAAGYVGDDAETIVTRLIDAAGGDLKRAERGMIYIDELDKLAKRGESMSITKDVSGEEVQNALLKLIEGSVIAAPLNASGRKHPGGEVHMIDTTGILFICAGAFEGLDKIIEKRLEKGSIGFGASVSTGRKNRTGDLFKQVINQDLLDFGIKSELLGRLPVVTTLEDLTVDILVRIMSDPKNALVSQFHRMFDMELIELVFTETALQRIATDALKSKTGARGLRSQMEKILMDDMFEAPDMEDVERIVVDVVDDQVQTSRVMKVARKAA